MAAVESGSGRGMPSGQVHAVDGPVGALSHVLRDRVTGAVDWLLVRRGDRYHALPASLVTGWEGGDGRIDATVDEISRVSEVSPDVLWSDAALGQALREIRARWGLGELAGTGDTETPAGVYDVEIVGTPPIRWLPEAGSPPAPVTRGWPDELPGPPDGGPGEDLPGTQTPRSLIAELPEEVAADSVFGVQVSIVRGGREGGTLLAIPVPAAGLDVTVIVHAPGLVEVDGRHEAIVHVPEDRDSDPSLFEFLARDPGRHRLSLTAYRAGTFLGRLEVEVLVTARAVRRASQRREAAIATEQVGGEVTLTVLHDEVANAFTFHFSDGSATRVVTGRRLRDDLRALVERVIPQFDAYASGTSGLTSAAARSRMENQGLRLWQQLIPDELKTAFRERQDSITQLTVLCEKDVVPWELLYPHDRPGDERGFLVEQFPVVRWVLNTRRTRRLTLDEPQFVVPDDSPPTALEEVQGIRRSLGSETGPALISDSAALRAAVEAPAFDCLHFACHNYFAPETGSMLAFGDGDFQPIDLQFASVDKPLAQRGALVFLNACRSQGAVPTFTTLDGWAGAFLDAGASFFIGTSWAVRDATAREFAQVVYGELKRGETLGTAVTTGRRAISGEVGDSTWLAYTVYGDPRAMVGASR